MPTARSQQISLEDTAYYHCVSRCVHRAFLCGFDEASGKSYEHRRGWVESRLLQLAGVFAIDVCAYAVMSNHTHVVLHINEEQAMAWDAHEVLRRWHQLHIGTLLTTRFINGESLDKASLQSVMETVEVYRQRLYDISWFMRNLNESIARQANKEDGCTGRFWEGRFKSQALLDEAALAACMAYVDLNPVRAKIAETPEQSNYTSVKKRVESLRQSSVNKPSQPKALFPFVGNPRKHMPQGLPFRLKDYLALVDISGRILRQDKRGAISEQHLPILARLKISESVWESLITTLEREFTGPIGGEKSLRLYQSHKGLLRMQGIGAAKRCFKVA
ncbi:transposase [Vibrio sp. WXL210]|uniref:transposase n=1 Tax=Vibrio sp. WXL210 TaxID=3450709 RepID=UPI003EC7195A